jgi:hypothetical protein
MSIEVVESTPERLVVRFSRKPVVPLATLGLGVLCLGVCGLGIIGPVTSQLAELLFLSPVVIGYGVYEIFRPRRLTLILDRLGTVEWRGRKGGTYLLASAHFGVRWTDSIDVHLYGGRAWCKLSLPSKPPRKQPDWKDARAREAARVEALLQAFAEGR